MRGEHYRHYWFPFVQQTIRRYPKRLLDENTEWSIKAHQAISEAMEAAAVLRDGADIIALVKMLHLDKTHTIGGAAMVLHVSRSTATRWNRKFVYMVAERLDFIKTTK